MTGKKKETEYQQEKRLIKSHIASIKRATKRKPAQVLLWVDDALAAKLIEDGLSEWSGRGDKVRVRNLTLSWEELNEQ